MIPVEVSSRDELGDLAAGFSILQRDFTTAALGLQKSREGLRQTHLVT